MYEALTWVDPHRRASERERERARERERERKEACVDYQSTHLRFLIQIRNPRRRKRRKARRKKRRQSF